MKIFKKTEKKYQFDIEQYAYYLIKCLTISEKSFFEDNKNIDYDLFSQTLYYLYHLYICEQLLTIRYSNEIVSKIILKASDIILDCQSENQIDREIFKKNMFSFLLNLKNENIKINNQKDLQKLAKLFLEDSCSLHDDAITLLNLFMSFTTFITYHAEDIINKKIKLKIDNC